MRPKAQFMIEDQFIKTNHRKTTGGSLHFKQFYNVIPSISSVSLMISSITEPM